MRFDHIAIISVFALLQGCALELPQPSGEKPSAPGAVTTDAGSDTSADVPGDDNDDASDGESDTPDGVEDGVMDTDMGPVYASCAAVKANNASATSGVYRVDFGGQIIPVYCGMRVNGEWTLVGVITNQGDDVWSPDHMPNFWEDTEMEEYGTLDPTANADYRSPAWHLMPATDLRIEFNGESLLTARDCLGDTSTSLAEMMASLSWECGLNNPVGGCSHLCPLSGASQTTHAEERALIGDTPRTTLYLKGGDNDEDIGDIDRVYISSDRRGDGDEPRGLGARCQNFCGGMPGDADVNDRGEGINAVTSDHWYTIWVK